MAKINSKAKQIDGVNEATMIAATPSDSTVINKQTQDCPLRKTKVILGVSIAFVVFAYLFVMGSLGMYVQLLLRVDWYKFLWGFLFLVLLPLTVLAMTIWINVIIAKRKQMATTTEGNGNNKESKFPMIKQMLVPSAIALALIPIILIYASTFTGLLHSNYLGLMEESTFWTLAIDARAYYTYEIGGDYYYLTPLTKSVNGEATEFTTYATILGLIDNYPTVEELEAALAPISGSVANSHGNLSGSQISVVDGMSSINSPFVAYSYVTSEGETITGYGFVYEESGRYLSGINISDNLSYEEAKQVILHYSIYIYSGYNMFELGTAVDSPFQLVMYVNIPGFHTVRDVKETMAVSYGIDKEDIESILAEPISVAGIEIETNEKATININLFIDVLWVPHNVEGFINGSYSYLMENDSMNGVSDMSWVMFINVLCELDTLAFGDDNHVAQIVQLGLNPQQMEYAELASMNLTNDNPIYEDYYDKFGDFGTNWYSVYQLLFLDNLFDFIFTQRLVYLIDIDVFIDLINEAGLTTTPITNIGHSYIQLDLSDTWDPSDVTSFQNMFVIKMMAFDNFEWANAHLGYQNYFYIALAFATLALACANMTIADANHKTQGAEVIKPIEEPVKENKVEKVVASKETTSKPKTTSTAKKASTGTTTSKPKPKANGATTTKPKSTTSKKV